MNFFKHIFFTVCPVCKPIRSKTVRVAFPLVFVTASLFVAATLASQNVSSIIIESSTQSVRAGQNFSIGVYVYAHVPINAVDIELEFPKSQVEVMGIDVGESVITLWTEEPYVEGQNVILRGGTFRKGFVGKHLIATINARAVNTGLAHIEVSDSLLLAGDGSGSKVSTNDGGLNSTKLYIASEDGSFTPSFGDSDSSFSLEGSVKIMIITDIDGDGSVTLADISRFMAAWRDRNVIYDFSGDGLMTFRDFAIILADSFFK